MNTRNQHNTTMNANTRHFDSKNFTNNQIRRAFINQYRAGGNAYAMNLIELPDGSRALLDYDYAKLAQMSPEGRITVFAGWRQWAQARFAEEYDHGGEPTTARHVRELVEFLFDHGIDFDVSQSRPSVGTPPACLRELGHLNMIPNRGTSEGRTE